MATISNGTRADQAYDPETSDLIAKWSQRRQQARSARRRYEPTWLMCKSFVAGRQWVGVHPTTGRVIADQRFSRRERHTVNMVGQYVQTVLGKLFVEDLRPDTVFIRDDQESQTIAEHTRKVAKFLWDTELEGDKKMLDTIHRMLVYGTTAMRCLYDPSQGEVVQQVPVGPDGRPIVDQTQAIQFVAQQAQMGQQAQFATVREGRIVWEPLSPHQILPPPGISDPDWFPWLIVERAMPVEWAKLRFPEAAADIRSQEVAATDGLDNRDMPSSADEQPTGDARLSEHCIISTGYELPTADHPDGLVVNWSGRTPLEVQDQLPYKLKGRPHHGVTFFRYHIVPDRFWGIGLVEPLIGPQRQKNRARSQMIEMKDRNLGRVYARKGTITASNKPVGKIMELIEVPLHVDYPVETQGVPPGPWIENESRINDDDMDRVAGLREVSQGTNPQGVSAYSAMALLAEQDERRIGPVLKILRGGIGDAMLLSLELARRYWLTGRELAVAGQEGMVEMFNFERAKLPLEFYIDLTRNAPLPTSPAVESQKIFDIFNAATSAGQPLPIDWLKDSLDASRALPIPKREEQLQVGKAEQENLMMSQGQMVVPAYYDDDFMHIQVHRQAQIQAQVPGYEQLGMILEQHIQMHAQNAQMKRPTQGSPGTSLPQAQGARGVEAQNGPSVNQAGAAQSAQQGQLPPAPSVKGAAQPY